MGENTTALISLCFVVLNILPVSFLLASVEDMLDWTVTNIGGFVYVIGLLGLFTMANWGYLVKKKVAKGGEVVAE